jgi:hypothetical protein
MTKAILSIWILFWIIFSQRDQCGQKILNQSSIEYRELASFNLPPESAIYAIYAIDYILKLYNYIKIKMFSFPSLGLFVIVSNPVLIAPKLNYFWTNYSYIIHYLKAQAKNLEYVTKIKTLHRNVIRDSSFKIQDDLSSNGQQLQQHNMSLPSPHQ